MAEPVHDPIAETPSFVAAPVARPAASKWVWLGCGVLLVTLAVQVLIAGRASLGADARTRPLAMRACAWLGCTLPTWEDSRAFRMLEHDMRADPSMPGALRVQAGFRNDAPWPQAWPDLLLTLSDANGQPLAQRVLPPSEYLGEARPALIDAGQTASVQFSVREPAREAVAFDFAFRPHRPQPIH